MPRRKPPHATTSAPPSTGHGEFLQTLQSRFAKNMPRHRGLAWNDILERLAAQPEKLAALQGMERSGGEPDVIGQDPKTGAIVFFDCSAESPQGRRSLCYDRAALDGRKEFKPENNVIDRAAALGIELLDEEQYRALQKLGEFDLKSSSWLKTPEEVRQLGGALFGDRRYNRVFVYHNGAQSYYAARGFRGMLKV
ncbi:MAG: DUF4256 domain-containing protein [Planctomycetota bacterium]